MIYLDNAATTYPKPPEIYEKTMQFMKESGGNPGRGAHYYSNAAAAMIEDTRREVARVFDLHDFRKVIFTANCTDSINVVLKGFLHEGDHAIATDLDHNSISRPLESLRKKKGIEVTRIPFESSGVVRSENVEHEIRDNTKIIVLTHSSNVLGTLQDLPAFQAIAKKYGIPLLLDAAQSAGRVRISLNDSPVFLTCSGHKGLFGMPGTGILTVPSGYDLDRWREGGSGSASESLDHPEEYPSRLEAGTPNLTGIVSLLNGLQFIQRTGMEQIHAHELRLAKQIRDGLAADHRFVFYPKTPETQRGSGIVSFNIRNVPPQEAAAILDQNFGIAVRSGLHCAAVLHARLGTLPDGCIRISPGWFNTSDQIDALVEALQKIASAY